jgi:hypothetical protein
VSKNVSERGKNESIGVGESVMRAIHSEGSRSTLIPSPESGQEWVCEGYCLRVPHRRHMCPSCLRHVEGVVRHLYAFYKPQSNSEDIVDVWFELRCPLRFEDIEYKTLYSYIK